MTFNLDKKNPTPLYRQLADAIIEKIDAGELAAGTRLPAIRKLAAELAVNNTTLVTTYKHLEQMGVAFPVRGSGYYVADRKAAAPAAQKPIGEGFINFADMNINPALFPGDAIRQAYAHAITQGGGHAFMPAPAPGFEPLRRTISAHLSASNLPSPPDSIYIAGSARAAIEAVADRVLSPGDAVLLESPAAQGIAGIFTSRGARPIAAPIVKTLLDLSRVQELLQRHKPRLMFISPTFQVPTGESYPDAVKPRLVMMAQAAGAHILELDEYSDFFYRLRPTPVKAYDKEGVVSYVKSFDRTLAPGFAGYAVSRLPLSPAPVSGLVQRGLAAYLSAGTYENHLAFLRASYSLLYKRMAAGVRQFLSPHGVCAIPEGGFGMWFMPKGRRDMGTLADKLAKNGVLVTPGTLFDAPRALRLSFANIREDKIAEGLGIIASVLSKK